MNNPDVMSVFLTQLGANGPWALVAGFLLWQVIKAWNADRATTTQLLGEFRSVLDRLATEIHNLVQLQAKGEDHH